MTTESVIFILFMTILYWMSHPDANPL